jgi:hypothetical protein
MVVGAGSDKLYQGAQRYLVRWDPEKRLPTTEVIDNGVLGRHDVCLMRAIESAVSEVLKYIKEQDTRK